MAVIGLGMDVCDIGRIRRLIDAAPAYAARFAAKEALVKALGAPKGVTWQDMDVAREGGAPFFRLSGVAAHEVERRGVAVLLALTHDAGVAAATVILEGSR